MRRFPAAHILVVVCLALAGLAVLPARPAHAAVAAQRIASGLAFPAAFTVTTDRILYGERLTGAIRVIDLSTGADRLLFRIPDVAADGDEGLLGVEVHPNYPATPYVYAFVTHSLATGPVNQIVRITHSGGTGTNLRVLRTLPAGPVHNGGRLLFGPGAKLYAVLGEHGTPANAQDPASLAGKVLRMTASGGVPTGNPIPGSPVFATGIRNSFGMAFDPRTGRLWESDNGPQCNDEVNRIVAGGNYGWGPSATCATPPQPPANTNLDGPSPILPRRFFATPIAPTGVAFCDGCGLGADSEGELFMGDYKTGTIRRIGLDTERRRLVGVDTVYTHPSGILAMEAAPGGTLYFSDASAIHRLVLA